MKKISKKVSGISLIELLISLVINAFILMGLTIAFTTSQKNLNMQFALQQIQENATQAFYYLQKNIRAAGIHGCNVPVNTFLKADNQSFEIERVTSISANVLEKNNAVLTLTSLPYFHAGDNLLISDCEHFEIAKVTAVILQDQSQKVFLLKPLIFEYNLSAKVKRIDHLKFFVRETHRLDQWKKPISALYAQINQHRLEELVEGVRKLRLRFDELVANTLQTKDYQQVTHWKNVKGIALTLYLSSVGKYPMQKVLHSYAALHENVSA